MEEVKRQVKLALDERENESRRLADENRELRQLVMELTGPPGDGPDLNVDGDVRGSEGRVATMRLEPHGGVAGEGRTSSNSEGLRAPAGLPLQSQVPGGQGLAERVRVSAGLLLQSQVPGGHGHLDNDEMPSGPQGHDQQFVAGHQASHPTPHQVEPQLLRLSAILQGMARVKRTARSLARDWEALTMEGAELHLPTKRVSRVGPWEEMMKATWWGTCIYLCKACGSYNSRRWPRKRP